MREFDRAELEGLTLEEACQLVMPHGYMVLVHQHDEDAYSIDELERTYRIRKMPHQIIDTPRGKRFVFVSYPTLSIDLQDGRVYDFEVYFPKEEDNV